MQWGKLLKKGKKNKVIQTFLNKHKKNVKKESVQKKVPFFKGIKTLQQLVHLSKPKKAITSDSSIVDIEKTTTDLVTSTTLQVQGTDMKQPGVKFSPSFGFNKLRRQLQEKTVKSPFKLQKFKQNKAALKSTIKEIQGKEEPSSAITTATKLSFPRSFGISKIKQKLSSLKISKKKRKRSGKLLWTVVQKKMMRKQSIFDVVVKKKFNWTFNTPTSPKLPIFSLKKRNLKKFTNLKKVQNLMKLKVFSSSVQKQNIPTSLPDKEWRKVRKYLQVGAASQEILTSLRKVSIAKTLRLSGKSLVQRVIRRMRQVPVDPAFSVQSSSIRGSISIIDAAEEQRKVACHTVALRFMEDYILETAFTKRLHFYSTRATQIQSQVRRRQAVFRCIILKREKVANELYTFSMLVQKENTAQILHARQRHAAVHLQRLWRGIKGRQRFQRQTIRFVERRKRQIQRNRLQAARKSLATTDDLSKSQLRRRLWARKEYPGNDLPFSTYFSQSIEHHRGHIVHPLSTQHAPPGTAYHRVTLIPLDDYANKRGPLNRNNTLSNTTWVKIPIRIKTLEKKHRKSSSFSPLSKKIIPKHHYQVTYDYLPTRIWPRENL